MILVPIILAIVFLSYTLSRATDFLVSGLEQLSDGSKLKTYGVTAFFMSLATSFPEIFVVISSALQGGEALSVGVIVGSSISNISLVIGGAALISGSIQARDKLFWRDVVYAFIIGCLPLVMLLDKVLSRIDGLVLILIYGLFIFHTLRGKSRKRLDRVEDEYYYEPSLRHRILNILGRRDLKYGLFRISLGAFLLVVCADWIVRLAEYTAWSLSLPIILIGMFLVSIGATLPEFVFGIRTVAKHQYTMTLGNLVGSVVTNSSAVLGLGAIIRPIRLDGDSTAYYISVLAFLILFGIFVALIQSEKKLTRIEGMILVGGYLLFALIQFVMI